MKLKSLQTFLSDITITISDCPQLVKKSTSFRMILNQVTKLAELPECLQLVKNFYKNNF